MTDGGGMFVQVSPDSVNLAGESIGLTNLPGNVTRALAEDVSYRNREVASLASLFLRHGRKRKLTVEDMNLALKWSDVEQVVGQGGPGEVAVSQLYNHLSEVDLWVDTDRERDLVEAALAEKKPVTEAEVRLGVSASWLHVEGSVTGTGDNTQTAPLSLSGPLLQYYNALVSCALGDSDPLFSAAMKDVSSNGKISPLLTHLITFIRHIIKRFPAKTLLQTRMLRLISAIFSNPKLNLSPKPYLSHLVTALLETILSRDPGNTGHVTFACSILSLALSRWATPVNQLKSQTLKHLREVGVVQGVAQYGAVTCLLLLGPEVLCETLQPWPAQLWAHMNSLTEPRDKSSCLALSALSRAGTSIINYWLDKSNSKDWDPRKKTPRWEFYGEMFEFYGDYIIPQLNLISRSFDNKIIKKQIRPTDPVGRLRIRKHRILSATRNKTDGRPGQASDDRTKSVLSVSENFEFLADMGVPSDIFDEPVTGMEFTDSLSENRPQYSQQSSVTSNNPLPRVMSRAVKEMFPESSPVRRPRGHTVRLPGLSATSRSRRMTVTAADTARPHLVTWRHLVSGGRLGTKCRRAEGNRIDKVFSYVDIIVSI